MSYKSVLKVVVLCVIESTVNERKVLDRQLYPKEMVKILY